MTTARRAVRRMAVVPLLAIAFVGLAPQLAGADDLPIDEICVYEVKGNNEVPIACVPLP